MTDIYDLANMESEDAELVPEILSVDARLGIRGNVKGLIALFERAASVTPTKEIITGTSHALLEAFASAPGELAYVRITATDGDQTVSVVSDSITVLMAGAALLPPKRVLDILKLAPGEDARIEVLSDQAHIRSGRAQWSVKTPVGDSLPPVADVDSIKLYTVAREPFLAALKVVRHAVADKGGRPALEQAEIRDQTVIGMDGGKLLKVDLQVHKDVQLSIPVKVLDELIRALSRSASENIEIGGDNFHLVFKIDTDSLIAQKLLVGFPSTQSLLLGPAFGNNWTLEVHTIDLMSAIRRVRVNSDPDYQGIFLTLTPGKKTETGHQDWTMAVRSRDRIGNTAQELLTVEFDGPAKPRELCLNHKQLMDVLLCLSSDEPVSFKVGDDTKSTRQPLYFENQGGITGLVVQMRPDWL